MKRKIVPQYNINFVKWAPQITIKLPNQQRLNLTHPDERLRQMPLKGLMALG